MFRVLLRLLVLAVILVVVAAFFYGYRWGGTREAEVARPSEPVATDGTVDRGRAREVGGEIADKVAAVANRSEQALSQASVTAKIKSKMALDDTLDGANVTVDTAGNQVTLDGTVISEAQRHRAVQLARETDGVTTVVDRIAIAGR
jgi:osmotically-inducible protein OsmY